MAEVGVDAVVNNVGLRTFEDDVGLGHQVRGYDENGNGRWDIEEEGKVIDIGCETENEGIQDPDDNEKEAEAELNGVAASSFASGVSVFMGHDDHFNI